MKRIFFSALIAVAGIISLNAEDYWSGVKIYHNDDYIKIYSESFDSLAYVKSYKVEESSSPVATMVPNTTIAEIKQIITNQAGDKENFAIQLGEKANGEHYIIHGYVISTDRDNALYRYLVLQDETGAIPIVVRIYNLWLRYQIGQEIVVDLTGLYIGKYAEDYEIGWLSNYNDEPVISYLEPDIFREHVELNGLPVSDFKLVDYSDSMQFPKGNPYYIRISLEDMAILSFQKNIDIMGQLVEIPEISYQGAGELPFAEFLHTTNRIITDFWGYEVTTQNSGYASYFDELLPTGTGTIRGIVKGYYGLVLLPRTADDINFPTFTYKETPKDYWSGLNTYLNGMSGHHIPTDIISEVEFFQEEIPSILGTGAWDDPYCVPQVIKGVPNQENAWVTGYIVGYTQTTDNFTLNAQSAVFSAEGAPRIQLLLAGTPDERDWGNCMTVQLSSNTVRDEVSLASHPENLGKQVTLRGEVGASYYGVKGLRLCDMYNWGPEGIEIKSPIEGGVTFLTKNMNNFSVENTALPEGLSTVWTWNDQYDCAYANSYSQGNKNSEGYLISPEFTLHAENPEACFTQAINYLYQNNREDYLNVCVREVGSNEWKKVEVNKWPQGSNWTYEENCYIDLSDFGGKTIQIGFHYISDTTCCPVWEVKDLIVRLAD